MTIEGALTVPLTPGPPAPESPVVPETIPFPLRWLLERGIPPIAYRTATEIARVAPPARAGVLPYAYEPALALALQQSPDGTWNRAMLTVPGPRADLFHGVGTIPAVRRLLEYAWDRESPPLVQARRILFRLLAEDADPSFLFELMPRTAADQAAVQHGRGILREAAAAALAAAGYETDPRLRGAARRIVERVDVYLRSPLAQKPFVRAGNQHVLAPGSAPPSIYTLEMLAYMPHFRSEHYDIMDRLYTHLIQPVPRAAPASVVGKRVVAEPHLVLGDPLPHRNAADADIPSALAWLELLARLGLLRRHDPWMKLFERFLDDCDDDLVWRVPKRTISLRSGNPFAWPSFPLEPHAPSDAIEIEVTFRLGLIARHAGRSLEFV